MKKTIITLIVALALLFVIGCNRGKPENMSDTVYEYGLSALETVDDYLDGKIDEDTAEERLDRVGRSVASAIDREKEELGTDVLLGTIYSDDTRISHYIVMVGYEIFQKDSGTGKTSEILKFRNSLADCLNQKKR